MRLKPEQRVAVDSMFNGCILNGGVGSGKTLTSLVYYFELFGGEIDGDIFKPMDNPRKLYIITTAANRDKREWHLALTHFLLDPDADDPMVVVDSWQNIKKYKKVTNAFFIFDEQRVIGSGVWVKAFLTLARKNKWILLTATAGEKWEDYIPVFVANGFYRNKTELLAEHAVYSRYTKYPKIDRFINEGKLLRFKYQLLIPIDIERDTIRHDIEISVSYDRRMYMDAMIKRWSPFKNEPFINAADLCYTLRKITNMSEERSKQLVDICNRHKKVIIFYNFNYELDILREITYPDGFEIAEWNGHKHEPIPDCDNWVYLVQYTAGCEGWNCILTDTMVFYSQNYSYKVLEQAKGRIDRINTPFIDLYYYHFVSKSNIDLSIKKALKNRKNFSEQTYGGKYLGGNYHEKTA